MSEPTFLNDKYIRTSAVLDLIRRVLKRLLLAGAAIAVVGAVVGLIAAGLPGLWGALVAVAIGLVFTATTVAALYLVAGRGPELLQVVLLGGWIVKMGLLALVLLWLREQDFYSLPVFLVTLFVQVIVAVVVELYTVVTARIPYVTPEATASTEATQADPDGPTADGADVESGSPSGSGSAGENGPAEDPGATDGSSPRSGGDGA
ncbi:hypothetical protein EXU48_07255 [Occultella glacieicola]|uniref:ATP synthase protein I n=1 Tax=Occultella glacieicola TaxID=2518684 RepID=A0ABY2E9S9_9MICO|nr:hypothetical protein [Occultella glacieicola]TDE96030.1 hypothetical protein EXU48_07255 [Occultella glacieicola]